MEDHRTDSIRLLLVPRSNDLQRDLFALVMGIVERNHELSTPQIDLGSKIGGGLGKREARGAGHSPNAIDARSPSDDRAHAARPTMTTTDASATRTEGDWRCLILANMGFTCLDRASHCRIWATSRALGRPDWVYAVFLGYPCVRLGGRIGMEQPQVRGLSDWRPLAHGGLADLWEARQLSLDRRVAVKIYGPSRDEADRGFLKEVAAASRLSSHPGIVTVYDAGILPDDRLYLIMEFCPAAR